jgi:hypothetical protein
MPVIRRFHGRNIYHFTGERDVTAIVLRETSRLSKYAQADFRQIRPSSNFLLNEQQQQFCIEFLEWLDSGQDKMRTLRGFAGTGKTFTAQFALIAAQYFGLLRMDSVVAVAPTHQATAILGSSFERIDIKRISTAHSFLNVRPKTVDFTQKDDDRLKYLLAIKKEYRTSDQVMQIEHLQIKHNMAIEKVKEFVSSGLSKDLENVRLIIVDEAGMINSYMFGLFAELLGFAENSANYPDDYDFIRGESLKYRDPILHPDLQILFMGDPAQLAPIGEPIGRAFKLPSFTELTQVVRYKGAILKYCNEVRTSPNYETLHKYIEEDETLIRMPSYEVLNRETLLKVYESDSVRFIAATNKRVSELNYLIRDLLKGKSGNKIFYEPGDTILTLSAVQHFPGPGYGTKPWEEIPTYAIGCSSGDLELHTSSLIELGDPVVAGDFVEIGPPKEFFPETVPGTIKRVKVRTTESSYFFKSKLGTVFQRVMFRYRPYASDLPFSSGAVICLMDPDQMSTWKEECKQLLNRARSTQSRSKTEEGARGQKGDSAKSVWKEFGLKDWFHHSDGDKVSEDEYKDIRSELWSDYYDLLQFADNASYSYASTTHRAQGATVDVIVIDVNDILGTSRAAWKKPGEDELWDTRKLLYTAASRAAKQLVFML